MELRQLRSFVAAAEAGNISRAAQALHLSQPALSRQIKALEDDLGVPLLERGAHSFKLTTEGQVLLREAKGVIARADQAVAKVRAAGQAITLKVGYAPSLTAGILPVAIECFSQKHPRVRVDLRDLSSTEMMEGLQEGELDVAVRVAPKKEQAELHWEAVQQQQWRVVMNRNHELAAKKSIQSTDLDNQKLVVFSKQDYPEYWSFVAGWFREQGVNARVAAECDGVTSLVSAVEGGLGAALTVEGIDRLFPERLLMKPLKPAPQPVCIAAGRLTNRLEDPVLSVFVEELKRAG
jgi:DNA-binding transcriptional LysR family regulator